MARLISEYREKIVPQMMEEHKYQSVMQVPRIEKITINMGLGEALGDKKVLEHAVKDMTAISGQKPVVTLARKSIAGFKIRDGYPIGAKVTLSKSKSFFQKLITTRSTQLEVWISLSLLQPHRTPKRCPC